jgi:tetratricopeptide (TPR) repeat protein
MIRNAVLVMLVLGLGASAVWADVVHLKDGRKLEGKVLEEGDTVKVVTRMGTVSFPKDQVVQIERVKTPADQYLEKVAAVDPKDAKAHWELAVWCKEKRLLKEMAEELNKVIEIEPDHARARDELNYVKIDGEWVKAKRGMVYIDGEWVKPEDAVGRGKTLYDAEKYDDAYRIFNKASESIKKDVDQAEALMYLGMAAERLGKWEEAKGAYEVITKMRPEVDLKFQAGVRREIIEKATGGMYLVKGDAVKEDIFTIDTDDKEKMKGLTGLQPLTNPLVMKIALRERCAGYLEKGKDLLKQAKDANNGTPEGSEKTTALLDQADGQFDLANRITADVARGFLVESVKIRVGVVNSQYNIQAGRLQGQLARLNAIEDRKVQMRMAVQLAREVDVLLASLDTMEKLASRYPDELSQQIAVCRELRGRLNGLKAQLKGFAGQ